jgi:hypothetical protein
MVIITMTTVGYGDFFPKTFPAKIVGIFCMFYGVYLVSLFVITLLNVFEMDISNFRAYNLLQRLEMKDTIATRACNVLSSGFKLRVKKEKGILKNSLIKRRTANLISFANVTREFKGTY